MNAGTARTTTKVPRKQARPPETIEKRRLVSDATRPASTLPSAGVAATCANSIAEARPLRWAGVTVPRIVPRTPALTVYAAPAAARGGRACHRLAANPEAAIAAPHS